MNVGQIIFIVLGILALIFSFIEYFLHPKSKLFVAKSIILYLGESERIKYQKAMALPNAIYGAIILISGVFFYSHTFRFFYGEFSVVGAGLSFGWIMTIVWTLTLNKRYLGYFSPRSIPGEYIGK